MVRRSGSGRGSQRREAASFLVEGSSRFAARNSGEKRKRENPWVAGCIFLMPKEEKTYLSSRIVKEIARLGGDVSGFVPACVAKALSRKFSRLSSKNLTSENSSQTNSCAGSAPGRGRGLPDSRPGTGGNSLRRPAALQHRPGHCRRRSLGKRLAVAASGTELRILLGKIRVRNSSARICRAH